MPSSGSSHGSKADGGGVQERMRDRGVFAGVFVRCVERREGGLLFMEDGM